MGDSSSSSTSTNKTTNIDKRQVVSDNALGITSDSSTVNVTQLDQGAIKAAGDIAGSALSVVKDANALSGKSLNDVLNLGGRVLDSGGKLFAGQNDNFNGVLNLAGNLFTGGFKALQTSQAQVGEAYKSAKEIQVNAGTVDNKYLIAAGMAVIAIVGLKTMGHK